MKLYRRKPQYATAMEVVRETETGKAATREFAVQLVDDRGEPQTAHFEFLTADEFARQWESWRVRPRAKKPPPSRTRNGPPKPKKEKVTTVNLKDVE